MKANKITSCYIGPQISPEQFVAEHFFIYLAKGTMQGYDGHKHSELKSGECCLVRKNHLARYHKFKEDDQFEKVVIIFEEAFLKEFKAKHKIPDAHATTDEAFLKIKQTELVHNFMRSLSAYFNEGGKINEVFSRVKREELLLILLLDNPELRDVLFDFGIPEKVNLEEFMNRNYKFNVGMERFAYLTGRSLTVFKKDFVKIFGLTPSRWLVKKRLEEAYFQIEKIGKKPTEIYIDLGFEDLSHFSFAFKKKFGRSPNELRRVS